MKIIISYSLLATLLTLTALATLVEAQGVNLTLYTAKNIYVPEDTILITAELHKTEDSPVQVVLESFLTNKRGTFVTMPTHLSLELGPLETRVITLYDITVDPYFYSDEYIVSARLLIDDEVIQSQELHFFVEETLSEFILNLYTCKDNACLERSKIFILDETIYLDYESDVPNLTVTANLTYPDKSVRELTLPISIAVSQIGTHQLEIIASKEGYRTIIKKVLFAVIEREAHIPVIQICNGNGICDDNENYQNCPQDCPLADQVPPEISMPEDITAEATGPEGCVVDFTVEAVDDIDGPVAATCEPPPGAMFPLGTTTVTCTASDKSGNTSSASMDITVVDAMPPVLTLPCDIIAECTGSENAVIDFSATAIDRVDGEVSVICDPASGSTFPLGGMTVECSAIDRTGNTASGTFTVTVSDTMRPVADLDVLPTVMGECSAEITSEPTAMDNCVGTVTGMTSDPLIYTQQGTYQVTWTFDDGNGNGITQMQTVIVEDTTPPTIENFIVSPDTLWPPNHKMVLITPSITASDNCDPDLVIDLELITMNEGDEINTYDPNYDSTIGDGHTVKDIEVDDNGNIYLRAERSGTGSGRIYTITYSVTDASGNSAQNSATVTVPHNQ